MKSRIFMLGILTVFFFATSLSFVYATPLLVSFEKNVGKEAAIHLKQEYGGEYYLPVWEQQRLDALFARLTEVVSRKDIQYTLTVLNSREVNAFAVPGGYIFITKGLYDHIGKDEGMLASVLAHEIAHVEKKHGMNALYRNLGLGIALEVGLVLASPQGYEGIRMASHAILEMLYAGLGREAEFEADALGQILATSAQFCPAGGVHLLDTIHVLAGEQTIHLYSTHPDTLERRARQERAVTNYWSTPEVYSLPFERRNETLDPLGRYVLLDGSGLRFYDEQNDGKVTWYEGRVEGVSFSPCGGYVAASIAGRILVFNRRGLVQREWEEGSGVYLTSPAWCPLGERLAFERHENDTTEIWVGYPFQSARVKVSGEFAGVHPFWVSEGVAFYHEEELFLAQAPYKQNVYVQVPIPQVVQRSPSVAPILTKEEGTLSLRRPVLWEAP